MYNATFDEPFFEIGKKLTEGLNYAFRGRAKNGAGTCSEPSGYGKYSEIWVVEVV
ncbi:hypothetical protein J7L68_06335 [bacterium]|nr:hypothetical protein [bacterium]